MNFKIYIHAVLAKLVDIIIPTIVGFVSYGLFDKDLVIVKYITIYEWMYLLYGFNTLLIVIIFGGRTIGTNLLNLNLVNRRNEFQRSLVILRELTFLFILYLVLYEYGYFIFLVLLPMKAKDKEIVMCMDIIFNIHYKTIRPTE